MSVNTVCAVIRLSEGQMRPGLLIWFRETQGLFSCVSENLRNSQTKPEGGEHKKRWDKMKNHTKRLWPFQTRWKKHKPGPERKTNEVYF